MGCLVLFAVLSVLAYAACANLPDQLEYFQISDVLNKGIRVEFPVCEIAGTYFLPHDSYCDLYYTCHQGHSSLGQCNDGLVFDNFKGCRMYHTVDCSKRPNLQKPIANEKCPRANGIFKDPKGCGYFYKCANGTAFSDHCPQGQMFEDTIKGCRLGTETENYYCSAVVVNQPVVPAYNKPVAPKPAVPLYQTVGVPAVPYSGSVSGFECPRNDVYPYGEHSRHPYPGSCTQYVMCMRDKTIKVGSCDAGYVFNPRTGLCDHPEAVPGCY